MFFRMRSSEKMPKIGQLFDENDKRQTEILYTDFDIFRQYFPGNGLQQISREETSGREKYKIHLNIPISSYRIYLNNILNLLLRAIEERTIDKFKVINTEVSSTSEMTDIINELRESLQQEGLKKKEKYSVRLENHMRIFNNPITIYIPDHPQMKKLYDLCLKLENCLQDCQTAEDSLSPADLSLSSHVSFRQETLGAEYQNVAMSDHETLAKLREEGQQSKIYRVLTQQINPYEYCNDEHLQPNSWNQCSIL